MYQIFIYILLIFSLIYFLNIFRFIVGLSKKPKKIINNNLLTPCSVIVAVKNGENSIYQMLNQLLNQNYNGDMEFIISDDKSADNTAKIIKDFILKDNRVQYVSSDQGNTGLSHKKKALDVAIQHAKYDHLLFTDVDCTIHLNWVKSMVNCFTEDVDYIIGHAYVKDRQSILNKFQRIDLLMLLFAARSMAYLGKPWACIGQNQAYTKKIYKKLGGFQNIAQYLQGDDTLFLQMAVKQGANVIFNNDPQSYVISRTELNWKNFFLQRARWSGDANIMWKFNINFYLVALATFNINLLIIFLIFTSYFKFGIIILSIKIFFETIMYLLGMQEAQYKNINYLDFICWSLLVPFYTVLMGISSFFNIRWKGASI